MRAVDRSAGWGGSHDTDDGYNLFSHDLYDVLSWVERFGILSIRRSAMNCRNAEDRFEVL